MRKNIDIKIINKSNIFDNSFINEKKNSKNSILKKTIKSMDIRNVHINNTSFTKKSNDRATYTRQNSNKLMEAINITQRNYSNKKLFTSNSYKRRERDIKHNDIKSNRLKKNTNANIKINKKLSMNNDIKHKKLLSLQTNINNYKNILKSHNMRNNNNKNPKQKTSILKSNFIDNKLKEFLAIINKNKNINKSIYNTIINNTSFNKTNLKDNKILNKSSEQRKKNNIKFQLPNDNLQLKQQIKNKNDNKKQAEKKQKTENVFNKSFIINDNNDYCYTHRNKPPSKIEICQTFSKDENAKSKDSNNTNNTINTNANNANNNNYTTYIKVNENEKLKLLKIDTNKSYNIKDDLMPKTATSNEKKKFIIKSEIGSPKHSKSIENYKNKFRKLKMGYNTDNNNYKSFTTILNKTKTKNKNISVNRNSLGKEHIIQRENNYAIKYVNSYNIKNKGNLLHYNKINLTKEHKHKNSDIFEVISDIKVQSFNEYEEDKKAKNKTLNKNISQNQNENKINNNININININYNNININNSNSNNKNNNKDKINNSNINQYKTENNKIYKEKSPKISCNNSDFIEDRDEYTILKETYSKDRFSFRPINNDNEIITNYQQYNNIVNDNINISQNNINNSGQLYLDKKDFTNRNNINRSILNNYINKKNNTSNNTKKFDKIKLMKKEISKIEKLKKIIKNKQNSKLIKGNNILNKSAELRYKKINK